MASVGVRLTDQLGHTNLADQGGKALSFMLVQTVVVESGSDFQ